MKGTLEVVTGAGGVAAPAEGGDDAAADHSGHDAMDYQKMTDDMLATMTAFPAETEGKGNAVLAATEGRAHGTTGSARTMEPGAWEGGPARLRAARTVTGRRRGP